MSPACGHNEEVAWKTVFIEIVVGQVKNLDAGQRPEPSGQLAELVDAKVEDPEPGHAAQGLGHLLQQVVEQVEDLEVLHHGHGWRELRDLVVAQGEPRDVLHAPHLGHIWLQGHDSLVTKVNLCILDTLGFLNCLLDHF